MKKLFSILLTVLLVFLLAACASSNHTENDSATTKKPETTVRNDQTTDQPGSGAADSNPSDSASDDTAVSPPADSEAGDPKQAHSKVLVVVFSATGTTRGVAEKIAAIENADLYEIKAAQEYTSDDLNWHDSSSRSTLEQNDKNARPEIGSESISLEGYEKIYIGFPIWWGEEPRILDTFVERYSFDGITMIPFCTSSSSGIGRSRQNLAEHAGSGNWLEGKRFGGSVSEADLQTWIDSLK
ncbi:MAG: flavodoxin [Clostridia bacterium]|nr:flavodoxin [Clostridia bacterium]